MSPQTADNRSIVTEHSVHARNRILTTLGRAQRNQVSEEPLRSATRRRYSAQQLREPSPSDPRRRSRRSGRRANRRRRRHGRGPGRDAGGGRRRATTSGPGSTARRAAGQAMSRWTSSPLASRSGNCRSGVGSPTRSISSSSRTLESALRGASRNDRRSSHASYVETPGPPGAPDGGEIVAGLARVRRVPCATRPRRPARTGAG